MKLIEELYSGKEKEALLSLSEDRTIRSQVARQINKKLTDKGIVLNFSDEQLMIILSQAEFANSDDECAYVAGVVKRYLKTAEVLPFTIEHKGYDLASRCLISLSFFYRALEKRWKYHSAPEPNFYREVGKKTFWDIGRQDVSDNFEKWENFMQENFV